MFKNTAILVLGLMFTFITGCASNGVCVKTQALGSHDKFMGILVAHLPVEAQDILRDRSVSINTANWDEKGYAYAGRDVMVADPRATKRWDNDKPHDILTKRRVAVTHISTTLSIRRVTFKMCLPDNEEVCHLSVQEMLYAFNKPDHPHKANLSRF